MIIKEAIPLWAPRYVRSLARDLRRVQTPAETALWDALRRGQTGYKFYRQRPIGRYIADFYCPRARLVIELDGSVHDIPDRREYDMIRDEVLKARGLRILRLPNTRIESDLAGCLLEVEKAAAEASRQKTWSSPFT